MHTDDYMCVYNLLSQRVEDFVYKHFQKWCPRKKSRCICQFSGCDNNTNMLLRTSWKQLNTSCWKNQTCLHCVLKWLVTARLLLQANYIVVLIIYETKKKTKQKNGWNTFRLSVFQWVFYTHEKKKSRTLLREFISTGISTKHWSVISSGKFLVTHTRVAYKIHYYSRRR